MLKIIGWAARTTAFVNYCCISIQKDEKSNILAASVNGVFRAEYTKYRNCKILMESSVKLRNYSNIIGNVESTQKLIETISVKIVAMLQRRRLVFYQFKISTTWQITRD